MRHARIIVAALLLFAGNALADPTATGRQTVSDASSLPATARDVDGTSVSRKVKDRFEHLVDHTAGHVNIKSYGATGADLVTAAAAAVTANATLLISVPVTISTAVGTISAPVEFKGNGKLVLNTGGSVTLTGAMTAPQSTVFSLGTAASFSGLTFSAKVPNVIPQWWGAKGDASADDTTAIQVSVSVGGHVTFPPGSYKITAPIIVGSSTHLVGGNGARIFVTGTRSDNNILWVKDATNVEIDGLELDGTSSSGGNADSHGIKVQNSSNISIHGNYIHHIINDGIRLGPSVAGVGGVSNANVYGNRIDFVGTQAGGGAFSGSGVGCTDVTKSVIANNVILSPYLDGIDIEPDYPAALGSFNTIVGNTIHGGGVAAVGNGISLLVSGTGVSANLVYNNVVGNTVAFFGNSAAIIVSAGVHNAITGNTLSASVYGIWAKSVSNYNTFSGNNIDSCPTGVLIDGSSSNNVVGNVITNATTGVNEANTATLNVYNNTYALNITNVNEAGLNSSSTSVQNSNGGQRFWFPSTNGMVLAASGFQHLMSGNLGSGSFNPLVPNGGAIVYSNAAGANNTGAFFIGPKSATAQGMQWDANGNITIAAANFHVPTAAGASQAGNLFQGSGVPSNSNGNNGDAYLRTDTPGTANQRLYVKSAGAWLGIL